MQISRYLKIKCDGDAENNVACSNCDYGTCVYDESPRKYRQVETLKTRIENLEKTLTETQINVIKMEKQILNTLFDCNLYVEHPIVFNQLRQIINESRCWPALLPVHTLLIRLSQSKDDNTNTTLKTIAENTLIYCDQNDSFNPSVSLPHNFIEEMVTTEFFKIN